MRKSLEGGLGGPVLCSNDAPHPAQTAFTHLFAKFSFSQNVHCLSYNSAMYTDYVLLYLGWCYSGIRISIKVWSDRISNIESVQTWKGIWIQRGQKQIWLVEQSKSIPGSSQLVLVLEEVVFNYTKWFIHFSAKSRRHSFEDGIVLKIIYLSRLIWVFIY